MPAGNTRRVHRGPGEVCATGRPPRGLPEKQQDSGFTSVVPGGAVNTFRGANSEAHARAFQVDGYAFLAPPARTATTATRAAATAICVPAAMTNYRWPTPEWLICALLATAGVN